MNEGWYNRGYLPHCNQPGIMQFITYRLTDSLPQEALQRMESELAFLPSEKQGRVKRRTLENLLDSGYGSCILRRPEAAHCVIEAWKHFDGVRYDLVAWVVMPNHVHVLVNVYKDQDLPGIIRSWKNFSSRRINSIINAQCRTGVRRSQGVWFREYWDRYIRDHKHYEAVVNYIHMNPVKAGLVESPEKWQWSSAGETGERG